MAISAFFFSLECIYRLLFTMNKRKRSVSTSGQGAKRHPGGRNGGIAALEGTLAQLKPSGEHYERQSEKSKNRSDAVIAGVINALAPTEAQTLLPQTLLTHPHLTQTLLTQTPTRPQTLLTQSLLTPTPTRPARSELCILPPSGTRRLCLSLHFSLLRHFRTLSWPSRFGSFKS